MEQKKTSLTYRLIKKLVWLFYPKLTVEGAEKLPEEAAIIVGNHTQMNGPIASELYCPGKHYTWCAGQMMHKEDIAEYAFDDFWSQKPKWTHPWYRLLSHLIVPLAVCVFNNANTIGVYRDSRIIKTFKETMRRLDEGASIVIFPEHDVKHNHILYEFQDRFIDIARMYWKKTGKCLCFVPLYIAPNLKAMYFGTPTRFDPAQPMDAERERIRRYLMDEITAIACALPEHTVVPYRNIPKKYYPSNKQKEDHHADSNR